ncbi:MAG: divergent polysaccharide deacetylase family protein, partial [Campylobacter sp.]|nr:divergent polysaccharide deacetylase family protein [Campylobacter sp.]
MSEKKTIKKRPKKSKKGRSLNRIYIGITTLAVLIAITLAVALALNDNKKVIETNAAVENIQKTQEKKTYQPQSAASLKKEYEKKKYSLKFDEDENLSQIFTNPKIKDEIFVPKEKKQESHNATKELPKIASDKNDTKNLLANLPKAVTSIKDKNEKNTTVISDVN